MSEIMKASSELAIQPGQTAFTPKQVAALRQMGLDKANEADLAVFFHHCVRTGLDPVAGQIRMIGRWDGRAQREKYTIQTGIDGYRLIAERTGAYAGSDESWVESDKGHPLSATVTVHKVVAGQIRPFTATAHWAEYCQTTKDGKLMGLWAKMPHRMLAKCAEALALRKAFPQDLAGVYTDEEMSQADSTPRVSVSHGAIDVETVDEVTERAETAKKVSLLDESLLEGVTASQVKRIHVLRSQAGLDDERYRAGLEKVAGVRSSKDLTRAQADEVIAALETAVARRQKETPEYWEAAPVEEMAS
jgi:phage recombination protein Bet